MSDPVNSKNAKRQRNRQNKANQKGGKGGEGDEVAGAMEVVAESSPAVKDAKEPEVATTAPKAAAPATKEGAASKPTHATKAGIEAKDLTSKDYYFDSYSHFGIHEEMLKDQVRPGLHTPY
jgi:hypothetical protein